jgi:sensor histidine kinase YesM
MMKMYDFIFTVRRPEKWFRHIVFWFAQVVFWVAWAGLFFTPFKEWASFAGQTYLNASFVLGMGYTYLIVYYIFPVYFVRGRKMRSLVLFFIFSLITYLLYLLDHFHRLGFGDSSKDAGRLMAWYYTMNFIINGPPVICAMFLTIKMFKNWYVRMDERRVLADENVRAELQLLKAQVHPHFLFNTLNNIYSFALTRSAGAGELVLKLSDTLRYMVEDCEAALVPLEKEIELVRNYIGLEQVRYGDRLQLEVDIRGDYEGKVVAPLLMIPFVENSFKHGVSMMRGRQWITLQLSVQDKWLFFSLCNSKPVGEAVAGNGKKGIGLTNVRRRLQLLYPGRHQLVIKSTDAVYDVCLRLEMENEYKTPVYV